MVDDPSPDLTSEVPADPRGELEYDLRFAGQSDWADRLHQLPSATPAASRWPTDPRAALDKASPARRARGTR